MCWVLVLGVRGCLLVLDRERARGRGGAACGFWTLTRLRLDLEGPRGHSVSVPVLGCLRTLYDDPRILLDLS